MTADTQEQGHNLRTVQWMGAAVAVGYPLMWFTARVVPDLWDPVHPRIVVVLVALVVALGSRWSQRIRDRIGMWALAVVYVTTAHTVVFVYINDLHPDAVVALFVLLGAFAATSTLTIRTPAQLGVYVASTAAGVVVAALAVAQPRMPPAFVIAMFAIVLALAYGGVRAQLHTLAGLARSEEALRTDIARREGVERALRASEDEAHALLGAIPDVLLRVTASGTLIAVASPEQAPLAAHFRARVDKQLDAALPGVGARLEAALTTDATQTFDTTLFSDGSRHHIELRLVRSGPTEVLVLVRDVTREREGEQEVRRAGRMVALGTLASGVAHEINNPLAYVIANTEFARAELAARGEHHDVLAALTESLEGATRIRDIVAQLKERAHGDDVTVDAIDVNEAVRTALRMTGTQVRHRAPVETDLRATGRAQANEPRLVQVLVNLLLNAAQALPQDRPFERNRVVVRSRSVEGEVVIEVEDNGMGIAPEALGRLFDAFYTTKERREGTGLGLYVGQQHIHKMGGRIEVDSLVDLGSTFRVVLPAAADAATQEAPAPEPPPFQVRRVLVVDDEPQVARALARLMAPVEVATARDGLEGLRQCEHGKFDVVLCDILMPGLDGIGFYERLVRVDPDLAERVVFITGGVFTDRAKAFLAERPGRWLDKPLDLNRLVEMVNRVAIRRRPAADPIRLPSG